MVRQHQLFNNNKNNKDQNTKTTDNYVSMSGQETHGALKNNLSNWWSSLNRASDFMLMTVAYAVQSPNLEDGQALLRNSSRSGIVKF
jgi:hypothetical protein